MPTKTFQSTQVRPIAGILVISLVVAVFGTWESRRTAIQAQPPQATNEKPAFDLAYIPRDSLVVVGVRPGSLFSQPALTSARAAVTQIASDRYGLNVNSDEFGSVTFALISSRRPTWIAVVRTSTGEAARKFTVSFGEVVGKETLEGVVCFRTESEICYFQPNETTVVCGMGNAAILRALVAGKNGASTTKWAETWSAYARQDAVCLINSSMMRASPFGLGTVLAPPGAARVAMQGGDFRLTPLWQKSEFAIAELKVAQSLELRILSQSATDEEAQEVHGALLTALSVIRMGLSEMREQMAQSGSPSTLMLRSVDMLDEILERAQVVRKNSQLGVRLIADGEVTKQLTAFSTLTLPAVQGASDRKLSVNNMRQLGIAFHNYHDAYKTFPAAVQIGPKNVPHSWRITLLPFLEQIELYNEYRQDEPWDSPNNMKLLQKMPAVFRCPMDARQSTKTSYFTFVGPATAAGDKETRGRHSIAEIIDGTSNTILLVEFKRDVPWTKPDEIPFDPAAPLPQLGGWYPQVFGATFCDGSVHFLPLSMDPQTLKNVIMRNDGNQVVIPDESGAVPPNRARNFRPPGIVPPPPR